jgi:hypothetical protein
MPAATPKVVNSSCTAKASSNPVKSVVKTGALIAKAGEAAFIVVAIIRR